MQANITKTIDMDRSNQNAWYQNQFNPQAGRSSDFTPLPPLVRMCEPVEEHSFGQSAEGVMRRRYRISEHEKLVLNAAIEMGLSHFSTGQVFGIPSVSRIVRE